MQLEQIHHRIECAKLTIMYLPTCVFCGSSSSSSADELPTIIIICV